MFTHLCDLRQKGSHIIRVFTVMARLGLQERDIWIKLVLKLADKFLDNRASDFVAKEREFSFVFKHKDALFLHVKP